MREGGGTPVSSVTILGTYPRGGVVMNLPSRSPRQRPARRQPVSDLQVERLEDRLSPGAVFDPFGDIPFDSRPFRPVSAAPETRPVVTAEVPAVLRPALLGVSALPTPPGASPRGVPPEGAPGARTAAVAGLEFFAQRAAAAL